MKKIKKNKKQELQKQNIKAAFGCLGVILASILFLFFLAFIFSSESSKGTLSESKTSKHLSDEIAKKIEHQLNDRFNNEYLKEFKVEYKKEYDTFVFTPIDKTRIKLDAFVRDPKNESKAGEWYKQQGNLIHFSSKYYKEEQIESKFSIVNPNDANSILITFEKGEPTYVFFNN